MGTSMRGIAPGHHAERSAEISLGIRASRVLALVQRALSGKALSTANLAELEAFRDTIKGVAQDAGQPAAAIPGMGRRTIASYGLTLSAAVRDEPDANQFENAPPILNALAADLSRVVNGEGLPDPEALLSFLRFLVRAADRATARSGETLVTAQD